MGPCLSTPDVQSPRRNRASGRSQGPSLANQPKRYSSKYKSPNKRTTEASRQQSHDHPDDYQQQAMITNTSTAGSSNLPSEDPRTGLTHQGGVFRPPRLGSRQLENEQEITENITLHHSANPPRPLMPCSEAEDLEVPLPTMPPEADWTPDDFPENRDYTAFLQGLFNHFESLLNQKDEIQRNLNPSWSPDEYQRGSTLKKTISNASKKKHVPGDTLAVGDQSSSQVNVDQEIGALATPGAPSTSSFAESPLVRAQQEINEEQLVEIKLLGTGATGKVHLTSWLGSEVAVKEFYDSNPAESERYYIQEANNLELLKHPCVVSMYGVTTFHKNRAIVLEYVVGGSLKSQLRRLRQQDQGSTGRARLQTKCQIALQAASAVEYLHSKQLIHFDLKADNFLCDLRDASKPVVKVADVGLSKHKMAAYMSRNMRGTLPWMAPELMPGIKAADDRGSLTQGPVDQRVDIYSFGVVLWEIWTYGNDPYGGMSAADALYGILAGTLRPTIPRDCPESWSTLMQQCWNKTPARRPTIDMITVKLVNFLQELH